MAAHNKPSKPGRPMLVFDAKQMAVMEEKLSEMCTDGEIAAALGIDPETLLKHKKSDPLFAACYARGKEKGKSSLRHLAFESARGCAPKPLLDADGNQVYRKNGEPSTYGGREPNITMQIALCNTYLAFKERQNAGEVIIRVETDA